MSENNSHQMQVHMGYKIDTSGVEQFGRALDNVNRSTQAVAESVKGVEQVIGKLANAYTRNAKAADGMGGETKKIVTEMKAGLISTEDAVQKLNARYKQLNDDLEKYKDAGNKRKINATKAAMAQTVSAIESAQSRITKIEKAGLDYSIALSNQSINEAMRKANKAVQLEKEKYDKLRKMAKDYQNYLAQIHATSSLTDFSSTGSRIGNNIFNAALSLTGVRTLTAEFQNLGREIIDIDYNLINTQRIMKDFSDETADYLLANAAETARLTNISISDAQELQSAWVRINDSYAKNRELLSEITTITSKFMNVGEIEDAEEAVKLLNASLLQFGYVGDAAIKKAEEFASKWAYMADITAMGTADEYGAAIARFAANMTSMNGSMDEAIALASTMADKLAKSGEEAGTSLKTFTAYMNRAKTRTLFSQIAEDLGDTSYELVDVNGKLKDFDENLRIIAQAYQHYKDLGNDVMAQSILEAVGATRQRDAAMAVINSVNDGSYDKYLSEVSGSNSKNYLTEQNAALMETFAAKWNELQVAIQEFGMTIARSGAMDGIALLMDGMGGFLKVLTGLPEPLWAVTEAFLGLKAIKAIGGYIGETTGLLQKYNVFMNQGTKAEIEHANAMSQSANAYMARMDYMSKNGQLSANANEVLYTQKVILTNLNDAYNDGQISANEYSNAVVNLIGKKQLEQNATKQGRDALKAANAEENKHIVLKNRQGQASAKAAMQQRAENQANQEGTVSTKKLSTATALETFEKTKNATATALATVKEKLLNSSLLETAANSALARGALALLQSGMNVAAAGAGILAGALSAAMSFLSPIMAVISIGSLIGSLFSGTEEATDKMSELNSELDEVNARLEELRALESSTGQKDLYDEELEYWKNRREELERNIEAQKELDAYEALFGGELSGGFLGIGATRNNVSENTARELQALQTAIDAYKLNTSSLRYYQSEAMDTTGAENALAQNSRDIKQAVINLSEYRASLVENRKYFEDDKNTLDEIDSLISSIDAALGDLPADAVGTAIGTGSFDIKEFAESIANAEESLSALKDDMQTIFDGASTEDLARMVSEYDGFYKVVGASTQEQIAFLRQLQSDKERNILEDITLELDTLYLEKQKLLDMLSDNEEGLLELDSDEIEAATTRLKALEDEIGQLQAMSTIYFEARLELPDLSDTTSAMESLVGATKELVEAQNQLANGTALSRQELYNLAMTYPELLYQADLFNQTTVAGQKAAIDAVMAMKEQELDGKIEAKITELKAEAEYTQQQLELEQQKQNLILDMEAQAAQGKLSTEQEVTDYLTEFNNIQGQQFTLAKQYEVEKAAEAGEARIEATNQEGEEQTGLFNQIGKLIGEAFARGGQAGVEASESSARGVLGKLSGMLNGLRNLAASIANALAGNSNGVSSSLPYGDGGNSVSNTYKDVTFNRSDRTIDGMSVSDWIAQQKEQIYANVEQYKASLGQISTAISNLEAFKGLSLGEISNNYSNSGVAGNSSSADKLDKAAEEFADAVNKLTNEYVKEVESLQNRIVKALKEKYKEQYNERKKLLEKEHNERVEQIQAEIDAINGVRTEDKQNTLDKLRSQLAKWNEDDSTLGKAKQKELIGQIEDLEKEMRLDELEQQLEDENESYQNSIDQDSEFYDAILKKLDKQMEDEMLYREANDMIRNGKIQEITDLLTEFDAQWDGWATLMGQTAGEIIAGEVASAIDKYIAVVTDDVKNRVQVDSSSSSSSSTSTSGTTGGTYTAPTATGGSGQVRITNGSAGMYVASDSATPVNTWSGYTGQYYIVNERNGRVALARQAGSNGAGAIGWIDKQYVVGLATGGYTGANEGLAYLHAKERVLNAKQTTAFENLVYEFLPRIESSLLNPMGGTINSGGNTTFNREVVKIDIAKVINNTPADINNGVDNIDRTVRNALKKSGVNLKK